MTAEAHALATLYADTAGQTAEMHPPEIIPEAQATECADHPEFPTDPDEKPPGFTIGVGYAGGGFGQYKRCGICKRVFAKTALKDGNQGD